MQQTTHVRQRLTVIVAALVLCAPAMAAVDTYILGEPAEISPAPQLNEGVLLGAPAPIAGKLGCRFMREGTDSLLIVTPADRRIIITAGSDTLLVDGVAVRMPQAAFLAGDHLISPLRPVLQAIGAAVGWKPELNRLDICTRIDSIRVFADEGGARVEVSTPLRSTAKLVRVSDPERAYVDIPGAAVSLDHEHTLVGLGGVARVRWGQFASDPPVARVVMDLRRPADVRWAPHPDGLGGAMVIGEPAPDAPMIERRVPRITGVRTNTPDGNTTLVRVELSDPAATKLHVQRQPPRVTMSFPDAAPETPLAPFAVDGPFVESLRLQGVAGAPGAKLILEMKQLIHFDIDEADDPAAVTLIFKRGRLADKRVVIDPGHGGRDSGARGNRLLEKEVNLDVARRVAAKLMAIGAQTVLTREGDVYVGLYDRPELANRIDADLFVSIHANAMPKRNTGHGTETFYYHDRSMCLGAVIHHELVKAMRRADRGLKWANFCVTRESHMPAVLVELLFLNSDVEEALLEKPEVRAAAADAIFEGLRQYVEGTGSAPEPSALGM
ncbi:MAG: N-acetylmuramoyl-L-alanine amidase [Armatimonadota bacterium]|jgi:N-acetylmuramoyl-L-alanine amidase